MAATRRSPTVDEQRRSPLADRPKLRQASFCEVECQGDGLPVECPPPITRPPPATALVGDTASREDVERIVGRRVELDVEHPAQVVEGIADRAVDLWHAARRVRILDLVRFIRGDRAAARCRAAGDEARRRPRPGPGCGRASW